MIHPVNVQDSAQPSVGNTGKQQYRNAGHRLADEASGLKQKFGGRQPALCCVGGVAAWRGCMSLRSDTAKARVVVVQC